MKIAYPLDLATTNSSLTALGPVAALIVSAGAGLMVMQLVNSFSLIH